MAQAVVTDFGWLQPEQMIDGLGLAETTPGPLILVNQFVAYLAGHNAVGHSTAILAALVALWVTFAPCFLWIFAGAPYIARISANPRLSGALSGVTAAVVGVILNLSVYFALHVLFGDTSQISARPLQFWWPDFSTLKPLVLVLTALAGVMLLWRHMALGWTLLACAGAALVLAGVV